MEKQSQEKLGIGRPISRRKVATGIAAGAIVAGTAPFNIVRAQGKQLKIGVLLPRSGAQAFVGQSCQRGADLAPALIKKLTGVDVSIVHADTESNVDVARTRAESVIQDGVHLLVGAFDSGQTAAIAQVAEQRGIPHVINIAAAPQITEQGYKYVFRNFATAIDLTRNGLSLIGDLFTATKVSPKTAVYMHVNDTFGQAMTKGIGALMPKLTNLPFKITETIAYDPNAKDLSVEVARAKATNADFLLLVCRLNDAVILRREMVKQRWNPMGVISPGSPGIWEEQFSKLLGPHAEHVITNTVWYNPKAELTATVEKEFRRLYPNDRLQYHGLNIGFTFDAIMIAAEAFKRAGSTDPKALADAIRKTDIPATRRMSLGGHIRFNEKGQVEGTLSACMQIRKGIPTMVLPSEFAEAAPVFPDPNYKRA
jgi:branched-chain amino acid transport system substrate-binding protein